MLAATIRPPEINRMENLSKRRSVIKRLHQKQIAIARRSESRYQSTWIRKWKESGGRICEG